jgi:hypothetical protein
MGFFASTGVFGQHRFAISCLPQMAEIDIPQSLDAARENKP